MTQDPFGVLGLGPRASESEIRARFRELAMREHPDVGGDATTMAGLIAAYREALVSVGSPVRRAAGPSRRARKERDAASFTVDVLPVEEIGRAHV